MKIILTTLTALAAVTGILTYLGVGIASNSSTGAGDNNMSISNDANQHNNIVHNGSIVITQNNSELNKFNCGKKTNYVILKGFYGAVTEQAYRDMSDAIKNNNTKQLEQMMDIGLVAKMQSKIIACEEDKRWGDAIVKISLPTTPIKYWVSENAVNVN